MRVVLAGGACVAVDLGGPGTVVTAVVGEGGDRVAEPLVARPAEVHGTVLAGLAGDRGDAGQRGDRVGASAGLPAVAPLGEDLGGIDLARPRQRREDRPVRVPAELSGDGCVQGRAAPVSALTTLTMASTASRTAAVSAVPCVPGAAA